MFCRLITVILAFLFLSHIDARAQLQDKAPPPAPDPGAVFAACMEVAPGKLKDTTNLADTTNYVFRGRIIALNPARTVGLCFDTEHMRVAGAWQGKPVVYAADKNMGPSIDGAMFFSTRPGPGWAKDGNWDDPRRGKEGPLPREWAHYQGLYVHGDKVVLSYTVGDCRVLELPGCVEKEGVVAVTRTLKLGPSTKAQLLLICEEPNATSVSVSLTHALAELTTGGVRVVAGLVSGVEGVRLRGTEKRLLLAVPPLPKGAIFKLFIARIPAKDSVAPFEALLKGEIEDPERLINGGPSRWPQIFATKGSLAATGNFPYVVDDIGLPTDNPWHASVRFGGLDFFPDGRAALCTWDGDVWIVSGLDAKLDKVRWKRFAAGLQQPLGLKIIKGVIHTAGRDQVTRLHDLNGDGEADFYENFNNDAGLTLQRHEFVMDLQTDAAGNLYYCRSGHYILSKRGENCCVYKLSPDGAKLEVFARGFREPNGMSIAPDGTMTVADNEGNGVPQTPLYRLLGGANYGYTPPASADPKWQGFKLQQTPMLWLPTTIDRSAGGQVWVTSAKWGPFEGHLLHTSYGHGALFAVLIDKQGEPWQGAVWKFPVTFASGIMRARFNPSDGQLYLCGLRGWSTNAVKDGQFCRVRYTGAPTPVPIGLRITKAGVAVTFSGPLDKAVAEDEQNWLGTWADPIRTPASKAKKTAAQELPIEAIRLEPDGRTVTVILEKMQPLANYTLRYQLKGAAGATVNGELNGTIHRAP
jgi:hypothetical protein